MARLTGLLAAAAIVGLTGTSMSAQTTPAGAKPGGATPSGAMGPRQAAFTPVFQQSRLTLGSIQGVVSDERGGPLSGALVSALGGVTSAMATTDIHGRFVIQPLAAGDYVLRVRLAGFVSSRREGVRVGPAVIEVAKIQMYRVTATADGTSLTARPILTAGVTIPGDNPTPPEADNHTETAWRLRHIKRSVLKQDGDVVSIADAVREAGDAQPVPSGPSSIFGRAFDNAANMAASFFTATPFSGEVNFLTTSALGSGPILFSDFVPRGVAYMSIGAPAASGRWDVRASMSQSDVAAWVLAGTFTSRIATSHDSAFGVSYSTQQYQNAIVRPLALAAVVDETRNAGEIYGSDRWTVSPTFALDYGARYAHYDYLRRRSLLSPRLGFTLTPFTNTRVVANVAQRMLAPGAEEFLPATTVGPWLPPERTFTPLEGENFRVERARFYDVGLEHEFDATYVFGVRRFQQRVDNQMATLFDLPVKGGPNSPGHYAVANAGGFDAEGWAVRLSTAPSRRVRGSVDYSVSRAHWVSRGDMAAIAVWAPAAIRPPTEDVHDLTTSLETEVPHTATRVFLLYKINTAFARAYDPAHQPLDYRFDVQINQALPFMPFSGTARWEVLVGLRNLFRDPNEAGSIYDELLVVRPPKRVIGGVLIRF
jgi:TonB dependent receptor/Carboxypeptidase regulatory-like domain